MTVSIHSICMPRIAKCLHKMNSFYTIFADVLSLFAQSRPLTHPIPGQILDTNPSRPIHGSSAINEPGKSGSVKFSKWEFCRAWKYPLSPVALGNRRTRWHDWSSVTTIMWNVDLEFDLNRNVARLLISCISSIPQIQTPSPRIDLPTWESMYLFLFNKSILIRKSLLLNVRGKKNRFISQTLFFSWKHEFERCLKKISFAAKGTKLSYFANENFF